MPQSNQAGQESRRGSFLRRSKDNPAQAEAGSTRLTRYAQAGKLKRAPQGVSIAEALDYASSAAGRLALFVYATPTPADIAELAEAWQLHPLLVEDLQHANQRPKLERYGDVLFLVVRSARYIDDIEDVEFAEFHVLVRADAVAVLFQDKRWIDGSGAAAFAEEGDGAEIGGDRGLLTEELLDLGPEAIVYRLIDSIVDGFRPVLTGLGVDKEQIERQVFSGDAAVAERIYRLSQEVIELRHATSSLSEIVDALRRGHARYDVPDSLQSYLQDVADHLLVVDRQVGELRDALNQILSVNATLVAQRQNEDMKKISGWAAILFAPTLIAAVYGMNFDNMPELHWAFGYPMAVGGMVAFAGGLYWMFKRNKWM